VALDFAPFGIRTLAARAKCLDFVRAPLGMRAETEARSSHNTIVRCGLVTTVTYSWGLQHAQPQASIAMLPASMIKRPAAFNILSEIRSRECHAGAVSSSGVSRIRQLAIAADNRDRPIEFGPIQISNFPP
jgi:hypothetical protein